MIKYVFFGVLNYANSLEEPYTF